MIDQEYLDRCYKELAWTKANNKQALAYVIQTYKINKHLKKANEPCQMKLF